MKRIFLTLAILLYSLNSFAQNQTTPLDSKDYLQKSKTQKKTAWILLSAGLAMAITGGIVQLEHENSSKYSNEFDFDFTGAYIAIAGGAVCLTSIPVFISASKNYKRAMVITIDNQKILLPQENNFIFKNNPSICMRIDF